MHVYSAVLRLMFQVGFQGGRHTSHTAGGGAGGAGAAHAADVKLQALGCFQVTMRPLRSKQLFSAVVIIRVSVRVSVILISVA